MQSRRRQTAATAPLRAGGSTARNVHVARHCGARSFDPELMLFRFAGEERLESLVDRLCATASQQLSEFHVVVVPQTAKCRASRGYADAIAAIAEVLGMRSDEAETGMEAFNVVIARRPASARERRD